MEYKKMEHSIGQAFHWTGPCEIEKDGAFHRQGILLDRHFMGQEGKAQSGEKIEP